MVTRWEVDRWPGQGDGPVGQLDCQASCRPYVMRFGHASGLLGGVPSAANADG